jgi:group I intron endonuclease
MFIGVIVVGKIFLSYILQGHSLTTFTPSPLWLMCDAETGSVAVAEGEGIGEKKREGLNLIKHLAPFIIPIGSEDQTASSLRSLRTLLRERPAWVLYFKDIKSSKKDIYKQLKGKSGVYLFINNVNLNIYVGSSITLARRMAAHLHYATTSTSNNNQVLYRAMKKYKLENFSLAILEFCASDLEVCANLEQKWIDYYKPTYNVLKIARSSLGLKHSMDTIQKLKERFKKESHPKYGTITSIETRQAISEGIKEFYRNNPHKYKGKKGKLSPQYEIGGLFVFCYSTALLPSPAYLNFQKDPKDPKDTKDPKGEGSALSLAQVGTDAEAPAIPKQHGPTFFRESLRRGWPSPGLRPPSLTRRSVGQGCSRNAVAIFIPKGGKGEELIFPSINAARLYFKVRWATIKKIIDTPETLKFNNEE